MSEKQEKDVSPAAILAMLEACKAAWYVTQLFEREGLSISVGEKKLVDILTEALRPEANPTPPPIAWKPTIARRGREVALIFDTMEEAFAAFELLANYDPNVSNQRVREGDINL